MRSAVCDMFGIEFPILAFSHCRDVVAEVSKAGGLGVFGAVATSPEQLSIDLEWIIDEVGDLPWGIDLIVPAAYMGDAAGGLKQRDVAELLPEQHQDFLRDLLDRYDVPPLLDEPARPVDQDAMFSAARAERQLEVALALGPALVANALGSPPPEMISAAHDAGAKVAALAGRAVHAERHAAAGVDLIIAQGAEAGGHTGEIGSMVLIPEIVDAVRPLPVLGAGGIGRGRQMAAARALGAEGVWCGSVWLTTQEAETHPVVKQKMIEATSADTVRSRSLTGKPARQLKSAWTEEWARDDTPDPLPMPLQSTLVSQSQQRINRSAHSNEGAHELANYFVGQVVGTMNRVLSTRQVVMDFIDEYIDAVGELTASLTEETQ